MSKQWDSPIELNTFTSEQGRKLRRCKLSSVNANTFVTRFVATVTHERSVSLDVVKGEIGEILLTGYAREVGLTVDYINALPKGLLPVINDIEINTNIAGDIFYTYYRLTLKFNKRAVPERMRQLSHYGIYSKSAVPNALTEEELAMLRDKLRLCYEFRRDLDELTSFTRKKVSVCKKISDLLREFPSAESYMDETFYEGEPNTPAVVVPEDMFQSALGKFAVAA